MTEDDDSNETLSAAEKLASSVRDDLAARVEWERKHEIYYELRLRGLRRQHKPFPGAADLHYPLADTTIEKLKPFYVQQYTANELLADFVALKNDEQDRALADECARFFDYELKQRSNFADEMEINIDQMLQDGVSVVKVRWDVSAKQLCFDAVDPFFFVVPPGTKRLQDADRVTEIVTYSRGQYERQQLFRQGREFVDKLLTTQTDGADDKEQTQYDREGVTRPAKGQIVLWTVYERVEHEGKPRIKVHTFAPHLSKEPVREAFILPDTSRYPFAPFFAEKISQRWYAARGVTQKVAPFQQSLTKLWNDKHDSMTFYNAPLFTSDAPSNTSFNNIRMMPGEILPSGIRNLERGGPPISFDQEMVNTRMVAEQAVQVPDFGTGQQINTTERKTATEVSQISRMAAAAGDLRGERFRRALQDLYRLAWEVLVFNKPESLTYLVEREVKTLGALPTDGTTYLIFPAGTAGSWNTQQRIQIADLLFARFKGDPLIDQVTLRRNLIEAVSAGLVRKLLLDPAAAHKDEMQDELYQLGALLSNGLPANIAETENHAVRIPVLAAALAAMEQAGAPLPPKAMEIVTLHLQQHMALLKKQNPAAAEEAARQVQAVMQQTAQAPAAPDAPAPAPQAPQAPAPMALAGGF